MTEIKVKFQFEKSTTGAHRFKEVDKKGNALTASNGAIIGALYVRKSAMKEPPEELEVTIR